MDAAHLAAFDQCKAALNAIADQPWVTPGQLVDHLVAVVPQACDNIIVAAVLTFLWDRKAYLG